MKNNATSQELTSGCYQAATGEKGGSAPVTRTPNRQTHGLGLMKRVVKELGSRAIDRRTSLGKALDEWRTELIAHLGGPEQVSTQELAIVNLAVKTKLMLDPVDAWLLQVQDRPG